MKIAYLILAHTDPCQLKRLIEALYVENSTFFFVHVDAKQNIFPFKEALQDCFNCSLINRRIAINWGGYSLCEAERELLRESLNFNIKCDRFILLSGLDYPLWSNERMFEEYRNNPNKLYIKAYNLSIIDTPKKIPQRVQTYHFRDMSIKNMKLRRYIIGGLMRLMNFLPIKKKRVIQLDDRLWQVWGGSQWFNITRECASYVLDVMEHNNKLCKYFKTSLAPDELMIQTIIFNSQYKKYADAFKEDGKYPGLEETSCTHYIEYKNAQKVFTENDFEKLKDSGKMFCRKTQSGKSDILMNMIDKYRTSK